MNENWVRKCAHVSTERMKIIFNPWPHKHIIVCVYNSIWRQMCQEGKVFIDLSERKLCKVHDNFLVNGTTTAPTTPMTTMGNDKIRKFLCVCSKNAWVMLKFSLNYSVVKQMELCSLASHIHIYFYDFSSHLLLN